MKRWLPLLFLGLLGVAAHAAPKVQKTTKEGRLVASHFATCVVKEHPDLAKIYVSALPGDRIGNSAFRKLFDPNCLMGMASDLEFSANLAKGMMAEMLILKHYQIPIEFDPATRPALDWTIDVSAGTDNFRGTRTESSEALRTRNLMQEATLGYIGECVVRADVKGTRAVFASKINSSKEMVALKAMAPAISGCVSQGETIALDATNLRSALAVAYYRLALETPDTGVSE